MCVCVCIRVCDSACVLCVVLVDGDGVDAGVSESAGEVKIKIAMYSSQPPSFTASLYDCIAK